MVFGALKIEAALMTRAEGVQVYHCCGEKKEWTKMMQFWSNINCWFILCWPRSVTSPSQILAECILLIFRYNLRKRKQKKKKFVISKKSAKFQKKILIESEHRHKGNSKALQWSICTIYRWNWSTHIANCNREGSHRNAT